MRTIPFTRPEYPLAYYNHGLTEENEVYIVNSAESVVRIYVCHIVNLQDGKKVFIIRLKADGQHGEFTIMPIPYVPTLTYESYIDGVPEPTLDILGNAICTIMDAPVKGPHINEALLYAVSKAILFTPYEWRDKADLVLQDYIKATKALYRK